MSINLTLPNNPIEAKRTNVIATATSIKATPKNGYLLLCSFNTLQILINIKLPIPANKA